MSDMKKMRLYVTDLATNEEHKKGNHFKQVPVDLSRALHLVLEFERSDGSSAELHIDGVEEGQLAVSAPHGSLVVYPRVSNVVRLQVTRF